MSDLHIPMTERLKSIPEIVGIRLNEEPPYEVLLEDGAFEIRRYNKQTLASVTMAAPNQEQFKNLAFETLAKYIFGGNQERAEVSMTAPVHIASDESKNIAMTAPVLNSKEGQNEWTMSFILPAKFDLQTAPKPLDSKVRLHEQPAYVAAAVRYTGNNNAEKEARYENELMKWLAKHPEYATEGRAYSAQYDAPFVIPFLKRNEMHVKLRTKNTV